MPADFSQIAPLLTSALVIFVVYRRIRRTFGKQPLSRIRLTLRIVILALIGALLLPAAVRGGQQVAAASAGLVTGVGLAWWGASQTRFERHNQALYFLPHTYTGILVSLLFLGRLAYRFVQHYGVIMHTNAAADSDPSGAAMIRTPLTLGMFYLLVAYYVSYYGWLLYKAKHLSGADLEPAGATAVIQTGPAPPSAST